MSEAHSARAAENQSVDLMALRKPFPKEQIGKLPRGRTELDYVGHADVTSRLLEVDPEWNWAPLASDENGLPLFDLDKNGNPVGLWIMLTVGDVTRLGYGSVPSTQNDPVKVLIGDALRNAAMRFGVALDLWAKGDRADPTAENPSGSAGQASRKAPARQNKPEETIKPPRDIPEIFKSINSARTVDELREAWKEAGAAGALKKEFTDTASGEKMTIQELLYKRNDELSLDKSTDSAKTAPASQKSAGK